MASRKRRKRRWPYTMGAMLYWARKQTRDRWIADQVAPTRAETLATGEAQALSFSFKDMSAYVLDTGTPANNFSGDPNDLFTYASPSAKWIRLASGLYASGTTLRTEYDASAVPLGLLVEETRTSLAIRGRELGNATYWTPSSITTSAVQGVDGVTGSATRISASGNNGTILATAVTSASAARRLAPFVRRVTGVGNLEWTLDGGATWTAYTGITSSWQRLGGGQTVANPRVGFRIVSSGDEFDIDFANGETGSFDTSPMHVDGATAVITRNGDVISLATSAFAISTSVGTIYSQATHRTNSIAVDQYHWGLEQNTSNRHKVSRYLGNVSGATLVGGLGQADFAIGTVSKDTSFKVAYAYQQNNFAGSRNGATPVTDASGNVPGTLTTLFVGLQSSLAQGQINGHLEEFMYLPRRMPNADMQTITTL